MNGHDLKPKASRVYEYDKCPPGWLYLDGVEQTLATRFSIDAGWIERYRADKNGKLVRYAGRFLIERKRGQVEFVPDLFDAMGAKYHEK